jgi:hypothetical protein
MYVFKQQDWVGEIALQIKGLYPTGARANTGTNAVIRGVKSGKRRLRVDQMENSQN